ncbi:MAG TPA: hypothetical protein VM841_01785 [Actinomycetota bacterium]|nr:hypothetical protein [Actinomycetota bacterium]
MSNLEQARRLLQALEPVAAAHWFAPDWREEMAAAGIDDYAPAYFCSRAAPLGPVPWQVVHGLFYNWNPALVKMAVRWDVCAPADAWAANLRGVNRALTRVLAAVDGAEIAKAAGMLREVATGCPQEGRGLYASYAALPWPDAPVEALWQAATALREFRGDTHVAVLVSHGLGPVEALVLNAAWIGADLQRYAGTRMWSEEDLKETVVALQDRAFLDASGAITDGGGKFREMIEMDTDRRALAPVEMLGAAAEDVLAVLEPIGKAVLGTPKAVPSIIGKVGRPATAG